MKKIIPFLLIAGLFISAKNAYSYIIPDSFTIPDPYTLTFSTNAERIGNIYFEIYGMDIVRSGSTLNFQIYTSYPQSGYDVGRWETFPGDLMINVPGYQNFGVAFSNHGQPTGYEHNQGAPYVTAGGLYSGVDWSISDDWAVNHGTTGYTWHDGKEVSIKDYDALLDLGSVTWNDLGLINTYPNGKSAYLYRIDVPINLYDILPSGYGDINVYWAAADCANDYIGGSFSVVPEPTTLSLLGLGLLGLFKFRRRKK